MCFSMHWRRRHWIGPSTNQCMERCTFLDSVLHLAARLTWIFCDEFAAFFSFNRCLAVCYLDFCNTSKLWTTIAVLHMTLQKTNWALKARLFDHVRGGVNHARWILNFFSPGHLSFFRGGGKAKWTNILEWVIFGVACCWRQARNCSGGRISQKLQVAVDANTFGACLSGQKLSENSRAKGQEHEQNITGFVERFPTWLPVPAVMNEVIVGCLG